MHVGYQNLSLQVNFKNAGRGLSTMKSTPKMPSKELRPSKYKAQLFDCGVVGKIQVLQIPETCDEDSEGG